MGIVNLELKILYVLTDLRIELENLYK